MLENISDLIDLSASYAQMVEDYEALPQRRELLGSLWGAYNRIVITQEVLLFYLQAWGSPRLDVKGLDEVSIGEEMTDRVLTVTRGLFVDIMSIAEKGCKAMASEDRDFTDEAMCGRRFLYLRYILRHSEREGLIDRYALREWEDLMNIRNLVVHNDSIADRPSRLQVGGIVISMRPGRMMKGPLGTFVILSEMALSLYYHWALAFGERMASMRESR